MNAAADVGFYPCDEDMPAEGGTALALLYGGEALVTRRVFAFRPESGNSSLKNENSRKRFGSFIYKKYGNPCFFLYRHSVKNADEASQTDRTERI